ncbi:MAG TPA: putative peptidoglycan glycosyltransferase FtsW [Chthoniobacteraceae bacterium]|jgi:cell division protein FtsW|nr:putative peptidoglycan glycosyltransferase FtsW [Chthoniobacteraceae bacterium]
MHRKSIYFLVVAVAALIALGIVMLFSTGAFAQDSHGDPYFFLKRQSLWLGIGIIACIVGAIVDYQFWQRTWYVWFIASAILLALCFVPHIGLRINGARRWVKLPLITFQPSDFAKVAAIAFLAHWYAKHEKESGTFLRGFAVPIAITSILMGLIAREIDMGTTALIGGTMFVIMFVAGSSLKFIAPLSVGGIAGTLYLGFHMKERLGRMLAFLNLEKYKETYGLQQWQALIAFGSGGVHGLGLGNGVEKFSYLPFAHTDFIFPMIGEELGLFFTLGVVFCYLVIIVFGTVIAIQARDRFGMLFGMGVVVMLALQAALNIGVTTSLLPNKGLPLPFISYGGSNLVFCLLGVGILINIYRQGMNEGRDPAMMNRRLNARITPRM